MKYDRRKLLRSRKKVYLVVGDKFEKNPKAGIIASLQYNVKAGEKQDTVKLPNRRHFGTEEFAYSEMSYIQR